MKKRWFSIFVATLGATVALFLCLTWAAGQAVAECAGAKMMVYEKNQPLRYNRRDMLNPWFVVER